MTTRRRRVLPAVSCPGNHAVRPTSAPSGSARGGRRSELATPEGRARLARSVRLAMEDGGVTFVKLGQVLSTRRDLLPAEFTAELGRLQDDAARVPWPPIEQVLRSELGAEVDGVFASFDRQPIAAASIAQVNAATLVSGARKAADSAKEMAPAWLALLLTLAYLAIALVG